jgi:hypothetical protein
MNELTIDDIIFKCNYEYNFSKYGFFDIEIIGYNGDILEYLTKKHYKNIEHIEVKMNKFILRECVFNTEDESNILIWGKYLEDIIDEHENSNN